MTEGEFMNSVEETRPVIKLCNKSINVIHAGNLSNQGKIFTSRYMQETGGKIYIPVILDVGQEYE